MIHPRPFSPVTTSPFIRYTGDLLRAVGREAKTAITSGAAELAAAARRGFLVDPDRPQALAKSLGSRVVAWIGANGGMQGNARHLFFANEFQGTYASQALQGAAANLPRPRLLELQQRCQHFALARREAKSNTYSQDMKVQATAFVEGELLSMLKQADASTLAALRELRETVAKDYPQLRDTIIPKALLHSCALGRQVNRLPGLVRGAVLQAWHTPSADLQHRIDEMLDPPLVAADFSTDTKHTRVIGS